MLERYSEDARQAVAVAGGEARRLGHAQVGTEHLLLGLLGGRGTPAAEALTAAGASLAPVREKVVEELSGRVPATPPAGNDRPYTDRANRALERASRLSLRLGSEEVNSGHVLLSVLDVEGTAGQVLRRLGVDPAAVRQALAELSAPPAAVDEPETPAPAPEPPAGERRPAAPVCGACSTPLAGSLDRAVVALASGGQATVYYCTVCGAAVGVAGG